MQLKWLNYHKLRVQSAKDVSVIAYYMAMPSVKGPTTKRTCAPP